MKWTIEYFEQEDTTQPAELFEDELDRTYPALSGKLVQITDQLVVEGHQLGGGYIKKCHDYKGMNRYEQRRQKRLQNPEIAAGYREMAAELELMRALDEIRKQQKITKEALAAQMGKKREAISRLFTADEINPTLDTLLELLSALNVTADITLRRSTEGEGPIKVVTELSS